MKPTYVYFLVGKNDHSGYFKIGLSADPYSRQGGLQQEVDLERSVCVGYKAEEARENERWLHTYFADFRICRSAIGNGGGCTEWFAMECFDDAVEILEANPGATGVIKIEQLSKRLTVELAESQYIAFRSSAFREGKTIKQVVMELIQGYLDDGRDDERQSA